MRMKSVHLDHKLSATARLPKRSTIVESPAGRTVQTSEPSLSTQRATPQEVIKPPQPQCSGLPPSCNQLRSPGTLDTNVQSQQSSRPNLVRKNTEVKIIDNSAPNSPAAAPEDSEQRQSLL